MEETEEEIDLLELVKYVLRGWKIWVAAAVIGGLLGCGFSAYKQKQMAFENLDSYLTGIIEKDPEAIDKDNAAQYGSYKALYDNQLAREEKSIIYKMNQNAVYSSSMTLLVSSGITNLQAEGDRIMAKISKGYANIAKTSGLSCDAAALGDLIEMSFVMPVLEDTSVTDVTGSLKINIIAPTEQAAGIITSEIEGIVDADSSGKYEWLEKDRGFGYSSRVTEVKQEAVKAREEYLAQMKVLSKAFSDDEKLYCSYYYDKEFAKNYVVVFSKKYPCIGAFALCCIAGLYLCLSFVFNRSIKTSDELCSVLGMNLIAEYAPGSEEYIKSVLKGLGAESILICSGGEVTGAEPLKKALADGLDVKAVGSLEESTEAIEAAKKADSIILLAQLWKTSRDSITKSRAVARNLGKDICGIISVK